MALRVWLPLNGDLENKGISDYAIQSANVTIVNNGKIGKCYSFNGSSSYISITNFNLSNNWSYGCWINTPNSDSRGWEIAMILNNSGSDADSQFAFWVHQKENRFESLANTQYVSTIPYTNYYNSWHHFFATFNGSLLTTYIDGNIVNTKTITAEYYPATNLTIGARSNNAAGTTFTSWFQGYLNDIRVYDNCLSQKEVKEISQGLILHYKLDNPSITNFSETGNLIPNYKEMALGSANVSTGTWRVAGTSNMTRSRVQITDSPVGECYCFQNSGIQTANDGSCYGIDNVTYFEPNTEYRISMFARIIAGTEGYAGYNIYSISEELGGSHTKIDKNYRVTPLSADGSWTYCWYHFKTNSTATRNIYIGITTGETSVTTQMCLVRIDKWNDGMDITKIIDSSGYGNDGSVVGTLLSKISDRYQTGLYSNSGVDNRIITPSLDFNADAITLNIWFKSNNTSPTGNYHMIVDSNANRQWYEMCVNNNGYLRSGLFVNGTRYADNGTSTSILNGKLHMLTMTYDGNTIKRYVDSIMEKSTTVVKTTGLSSPTAITLFRDGPSATYACKEAILSDFRLYATALSAEDIADLYHTPASIDNLQNIHSFEFEENGIKTSIYQNGVMSTTDEIHESNAELLNNFMSGGYTPTANTQNSCITLGIVDFTKYASNEEDLAVHIECDLEWTAFTAGTGGTFNGFWWQGANWQLNGTSGVWQGTNYITQALTTQKTLRNATLVATAGKYHYDTIVTIPASWFQTYNKSNIGFRCDYSDGTGKITVTNFKATPLQYYNAKIGTDFISANNFIEK